MSQPKIVIRQQRDFGENINATFQYLKAHFVPFFKCVLFIAGPLVALSGILTSFIMSHSGGNEDFAGLPAMYSYIFELYSSPAFILLIIAGLIGFVVLVAVIYEYMLLSMEQEETISLGQVWSRARKHFLKLLLSSLGLVVVISLAVGLFSLIIGGLAMLGGGAAFFMVFIGLFGMFGLLVLMVPVSMVYVIQVVERIGFLPALYKAFRLAATKWWASIGFLLVMFIIYYFVQVIFVIPLQIVNGITLFHSLEQQAPASNGGFLLLIFSLISYLGSYLSMPIFWVGVGFLYFSLAEGQDLVGLLSKIDTIGQERPTEEEEEDD